ncbi:MAG: carotene biosynthesis protein [Flavobacteriaceae bacterium]|nr:carotene biosynthesis protein [Flavobacteriaceae bacterium]|tara:strand:- start:62197 stop:62826 length:630 start_codon:yes stop_codon:yes gene_type:complete
MTQKNKVYLSIFLIWLFNISGILGILSKHTDWFLGLTPLNLFLYIAFIAFHVDKINWNFLIAFLIPFTFGFVTEYLGVNFGLIFGSYEYGENLGYKVQGVPLMICVNWAVLVITSADISEIISKNKYIRAAIVGFLMMTLDIIIEVSAPRFDFWEFENEAVPLQNYVAWFIISFFAYLVFDRFPIRTNKTISYHIFAAITIFFITFLIV